MIPSTSYTAFGLSQAHTLTQTQRSTIRSQNETPPNQPASSKTTDGTTTRAQSAPQRPVIAPTQTEPSRAQPNRAHANATPNDQEIREAQLIIDNPKSYAAASSFRQIQQYGDIGTLVDTYA